MEVLAGKKTPLHIAVCLGLMPLVKKGLSGSTKGMESNQSPRYRVAKLMSRVSKSLVGKGGSPLLMDQDPGRIPRLTGNFSYSSSSILEAAAQVPTACDMQ